VRARGAWLFSFRFPEADNQGGPHPHPLLLRRERVSPHQRRAIGLSWIGRHGWVSAALLSVLLLTACGGAAAPASRGAGDAREGKTAPGRVLNIGLFDEPPALGG